MNCCNADGTPRTIGTIVLASGVHFAGALVGNYLAGLDNGVLLLTDGSTISARTTQLLADLPDGSVSNFYVIGGTEAVGQSAIDDAQTALGAGNPVVVTRVAGDTNIDTAVEVARRRPGSIGGFSDGSKYAIVATVGGFADSLSAAPFAYSANLPILFARPEDLPPQTASALEDLGITNVLIVGGTAAISQTVQASIAELGIEVQRLAGPTRQETSVAVAEFALGADPNFDGLEFAIARGDQFADSLSGGSHAGFVGAPILLTHSSTQLGFAAAGFLQRQGGTLETGWAYGGTGALAESVLEEARVATTGVDPE